MRDLDEGKATEVRAARTTVLGILSLSQQEYILRFRLADPAAGVPGLFPFVVAEKGERREEM